MSLSRFFKNQSNFKPKKLVPRPARDSENWQPVVLSDSEQALVDRYITDDDTLPDTKQSPLDPEQSAPMDSTKENIATIEDEEEIPIQDPAPSPPPPDIEVIKEEMFQAGLQEGLKQAESDFGSNTSSLIQACEQLNTIRETILKNSKSEMIELVLALSEKITRHSVTQQDQTIVNTVEDAIQQAVKSSEFYIQLNPDDLAAIKERSQEFIDGMNGLENIIIKPDQSIERGGCKIESDNCIVDATIASQLQIIRNYIEED